MTEKLALVPVKTLRKFLFLDSTHKQCLNVLPLPVLVFNKHTFHHHHHHFPMGIRTYLMVNCLKTISILLEDHQMNDMTNMENVNLFHLIGNRWSQFELLGNANHVLLNGCQLLLPRRQLMRRCKGHHVLCSAV